MNASTQREPASVFRKLLLSLGTVLGLLLLIELGVRLFTDEVNRINFTAVPASMFKRPTFPGANHMLRRNATGVQEFGSNPRGYFDEGATLTYHTNSQGLRGPDTTRQKPDGVFRILGLGDSYTFGTGVRQEHTFLQRLQDLLDEGTGSFEVLNGGVPAWSTRSEVAYLEHKGLDFKPDVVVICLFLNDLVVGAGNMFLDITEQEGLPWWRTTFRSLDRAVTTLEKRDVAARMLDQYREGVQPGQPQWKEVQQSLQRARNLSQEHGFDLALMIFPVLYQLGDYPLAEVHQSVEQYGQQIGIPVLDLQHAFTEHDGPELWVHPSNEHPNEIGHDIAGRALHRFLEEQQLLGK